MLPSTQTYAQVYVYAFKTNVGKSNPNGCLQYQYIFSLFYIAKVKIIVEATCKPSLL